MQMHVGLLKEDEHNNWIYKCTHVSKFSLAYISKFIIDYKVN